MAVLEAEDRPFAEVEHVGVVIRNTESGFWHAGLLYRVADQQPRILHLRFHYQLADDQASPPFRWAQLGLDSDNKIVLAELIARIAHRDPKIPYSFDSEGIIFDAETGDLATPAAGKGLTCATLIVAVLATYGHRLLDTVTWPIRGDDQQFFQQIAGIMQANGAAADHVLAVAGNALARLRPPEVVGAAITESDTWPVSFAAAEELASQVIADLS
ncbi:hypothetical protein [Sphingomonas mesophila]|uniref:hypothetical protein n=1 Tax=Sphingomonas mesophila TaxID=2303576 RepID=UPI0013C31E33|nr:hypothetical protein [Sphingomonas mesophila]